MTDATAAAATATKATKPKAKASKKRKGPKPMAGLRVKKLAIHFPKGDRPSAQMRCPTEFIAALNKKATRDGVSRTDIMRDLAAKVK